MLKIPKQYSVVISLCLAVLLFVACIAGAFIMPSLADMLIDTYDNIGSRNDITNQGRIFVKVLSYLALIWVVCADVMLFLLLLRVRKGLVFTSLSTSLIRGISWACVMLGVTFFGLGLYFQLAFIISFVALFLALCLRVVKNVIEEATEIKSENDLTV